METPFVTMEASRLFKFVAFKIMPSSRHRLPCVVCEKVRAGDQYFRSSRD